jgi:hypothetical protein
MPRSRRQAAAVAATAIALGASLSACSSSSSGGASPKPTSSSTSGVVVKSKTFTHISKKAYAKLSVKLPTLKGVQSVAYYKKTKQLQVYFKNATSQDEQVVSNVITQR